VAHWEKIEEKFGETEESMYLCRSNLLKSGNPDEKVLLFLRKKLCFSCVVSGKEVTLHILMSNT
jgi:hypothetical protein